MRNQSGAPAAYTLAILARAGLNAFAPPTSSSMIVSEASVAIPADQGEPIQFLPSGEDG